ncbi:hypothetical protein SAMN05216355_101636 [Actinomyces ruminicola]|uniref:Uncharacterized protein n=1 Tax=Actinomyces ruminicola TaxID=332524 RepID=A0A1H0A9Q4_9ACTO|nr:hypothetical protein [Actinomyces ruminicola]SDN30001.1 hypothetical protein SAMN05216355_101636 [Actinomyces ruminicola]
MIFVSAVTVGDPVPEGCLVTPSLDDAVDAICANNEDSLLVCSREAAARPSLVAREVLARGDVALVTLTGSPTQQALMLRALHLLLPSTYGLSQSVVNAVRAQCRTRVALSSVARLSQARPSLMQHVRSLFPGASFDVDLVSGDVHSAKPIEWNVQGARDICWAGCPDMGSLQVSLAGGRPTVVLPPSAESPYGARNWAEVSAIDDLELAVSRALTTVPTMSCRGCGRTTPMVGCPFCGTWIRSTVPAVQTPIAERRIS